MTANKLNDMIKTEFSGNHDSKFPTKHEFQDPLCPDYSGFSLISAMKELFESQLECKVKIGDINITPFTGGRFTGSTQTYSLYFRGGDFVTNGSLDATKVKPALYVNDYKKTLQIPNPCKTIDCNNPTNNMGHFPLLYNSSNYSDTTFGDPVNTFPYALEYRSDPNDVRNPITNIKYYNINCSINNTTLVGNVECSPINMDTPTIANYLQFANYRADYTVGDGIPFAKVNITATQIIIDENNKEDATPPYPNGTYTVLCINDKAYNGLTPTNGVFDDNNHKIYVSGCVNRRLQGGESFDNYLRSLYVKSNFQIVQGESVDYNEKKAYNIVCIKTLYQAENGLNNTMMVTIEDLPWCESVGLFYGIIT